MIKSKIKRILQAHFSKEVYTTVIKIRKGVIFVKSHFLFLKYAVLNKLSRKIGVTKNKRGVPIIISLTSFPKRIGHVSLVIETLLRQSLKPDFIMLWLSKEEFPKGKLDLPKKLLALEKRGLKIRFCNRNLGSYKKLLFTLKEFPGANIITVDDDIFYPKKMIEGLYLKHKKSPKEIICYTGHLIKKVSKKKLQPYREREYGFLEDKEVPRNDILAEGFGGIFYPPDSLDKEVFNIKNLMRLCPTADDIWFKAMAIKKGTKYLRAAFNENLPAVEIPRSQKVGLYKINQIQNKNEEQLNNVFDYYALYSKLNT